MSRSARYAVAGVAGVAEVFAGLYWWNTGDGLPLSLIAMCIAILVYLIIPQNASRRMDRSMSRTLGYLCLFSAMGWIWLTTRHFHFQVTMVFVVPAMLLLLGLYFLIRDSVTAYLLKRRE